MVERNGSLVMVHDLTKDFYVGASFFFTRGRRLRAVNGVSLTVRREEAVGLVGESGCGKSTLARCILQLLRPTKGKVYFEDINLTILPERELRKIRRRMQMVFQDPGDSLNPRMKVGEIVGEPLDLHSNLSRSEKQDRLKEVMQLVGLKASYLERYPHQFSGGQKQRIAIARAVATNPEFIVLDEPTSALDVSVRGQILKLLMRLQDQLGVSYLLITHDLSVVRHACQRVAVMYLGHIVEQGPTDTIFENPQHPYTKALLSAVPLPDPTKEVERIRLEGEIPSPIDLPSGCPLYSRCPVRMPKCRERMPQLLPYEKNQDVACFKVVDH